MEQVYSSATFSPILCFFANVYLANVLKFLIRESLSCGFFWIVDLSSPRVILFFFVKKVKFRAFVKVYLTKPFRFVNSRKYIQQISRIFGLPKISLAKFSQIKVFFGGPLTGKLVYFAVNYSGGSFLKMLLSPFEKDENFTWRNFLVQIISRLSDHLQIFLLLNFQISSSQNLRQ